MLAFSINHYGLSFRATQSVELFCAYVSSTLLQTDTETEKFENISTYNKIRFVLKVLTIIVLVCFFCPLYLVSCAGQEVLSVNGLDMTFGFDYMNEQIEGQLVFGLFAILPLLNVYSLFTSDRKILMNKEYKKLQDKYYSVAICSMCLVTLIGNLTETFMINASDSMLEIKEGFALEVMLYLSLIEIIIAIYVIDLIETNVEHGKEWKRVGAILKNIGLVFITGLILAGIVIYFVPKQSVEENYQNYIEESYYDDTY